MATTKTISVPVRYAVQDTPKGPRRAVVTPGMVDVRVLKPDEAPVVIQLRSTNRNVFENYVFRSFDGKLYFPCKGNHAHYKVERADVARDPNAWKGYIHEQTKWTAAYDHPFLDNDRRHEPGILNQDVSFEADAGGDPLYLAYLEAAQAKVDRHIVIDGHAWTRSLGPVLVYNRYYHRLETDFIVEPMSVFTNGFDIQVFDPFDIECAIDILERGNGKPPEVKGVLPEILSREGYAIDTLPLAVQGAAWGVLWGSRRVPAMDADKAFLVAVSDLRKAMCDIWGGMDIEFNVAHYNQVINAFRGKDIPDPTGLLEPLRTAVEAYDRQLPGNDWAVSNWRTTVERLEARVNPVHEDDATLLDGFSL